MKTTEFLQESTFVTQESPEDTGMVINNLHTIMRVTDDLANRLKGSEDLDEWVKEKIAVAKSMMTTVEDYVASQQEMGGEESLPSFDAGDAERTVSEMIDDDDEVESKIQHLMQKYGWSHQEALEYYYYEKHDPADWEGVAEGSDSYTVANDPEKPGMYSYREMGHALQSGHSDHAKIYKNNKFLSTVGDADKKGVAEGQMSDDDIVNCIDAALEDGAPYEQAVMSACEECGCEPDHADQVYRASGPDSEHIPPINFGDMNESAKPDFLDLDHDGNEKESMKKAAKDNVRVHKGTYGTSYDPSDEEKKDKPKYVARKGVKGRKPNEKPAKANLPADPFGRTTGDVPKGKKGTKIKGKGNIDEVITKKTSAGEIIHDFQKSKNPKFAGKSKEQRKNQALGAYYGMHPEKSNKKESMRESTDYKKQNFLFESFNFANMMKETDQTVEEMLTELQKDIATFKMTGECSPKLDAFLRVHGHAKKQLADEAKAVPNYEVPAVQRKAAGEPALSLGDVQAHDTNRSMHPGMTKLDAPKPAGHDELDELAQLAGITDEGNAFTGKLAKTAHGDSFELDGKKYKDTSNLDETSLKLEDIAKLAGIAVEGKDYGDTTYPEAPTYDNTPNEEVQGEDVLLKGGDGEVAGAEKKMAKDGAARFSDNPLAMKESETTAADLMKEAATFDPIEAMGRKLMQQYESIKLQK